MKLSKRPLFPVILVVFAAMTILFSSALSSANPVERSLAQQGTSTATATPFPMLNAFLDEVPFPRVYVFDHASGPCITNVGLYEEKARYANVVELHFRQGLSKNSTTPTPDNNYMDYNPTLLDLDGDGVCYNGQSTPDPEDVRVVDWLEDQWAQMPANAHGVSVPHYQIAFLPVWYFDASGVGGPGRVHRQQIDDCDHTYAYHDPTVTPTPQTSADSYLKTPYPWALHAAPTGTAHDDRGKEVVWVGHATLPLANVYVGTPVVTPPVDIRCPSYTTKFTAETPTPQSFVEWAPKWLEARVGQTRLHDDPTSYNPWDGVRIDSQSNLHGWLDLPVDYDLDEIGDQKTDGQGNYVGGDDTRGYHYTNRLYREGVHRILTELYQNHTGQWLMGGNDAWHPDGSSPDDPSGFGLMPNMHFTIAENWTEQWGSSDSNGKQIFHFEGWPDPNVKRNEPHDWTSANFSDWVRIWDTWTHKGNGRKGFVILSKCDDPLENKCNGLEAGSLDDNEYGWDDMHREFRFSLAAALMLDAYHAFTGAGYHMTPYWYDEYAVIWDDSKAQAARTNDEKAKGIGWLGFPISDPLGVNGSGEITNTSLCQANANHTVDQYTAWVRYFEHGVAILNPSGKEITVHLNNEYTYQRIRCSKYGTPTPAVDGEVDCVVNNGEDISGSDPQITVSAHNGIILYSDTSSENTFYIPIAKSEDDVFYLEKCQMANDDRGNLVNQYVAKEEDKFAPTISVYGGGWYICREQRSGMVTFYFNDTEKQKILSRGIASAYLHVFIPSPTPTPSPTPGGGSGGPPTPSASGPDEPSVWFSVETTKTTTSTATPPPTAIWHDWQLGNHHIGYEWHRSPALTELVETSARQSNWNNAVKLHMDPYSGGSELVFETFDAKSDHSTAPFLEVHLKPIQAVTPCVVEPTPSVYQATYQHGVNGYYGGEDTFIVTTDWEPPTTHDTHPALYIRVNYPNEQIYSSLIRFNNATLPAGAEIVKAQLDMFYAGQSVNGGDLTAYVAYTKEPWKASETTWVNFQTSLYWNATGVKGVDDRDPHVYVLPVNYQQVGNWLSFDVTQVVKDTSGDDYDFFFYGSFDGVNKNIYFHSNDYWKASERPKLTIWYRMP